MSIADSISHSITHRPSVNGKSFINNASVDDTLSVSQDTSANITDYKTSAAPIGLFDSGVGGLSVYLHLAQQLPAERYIYYADTLHVPYGNRDSQDIEELTLIAVEWLYQRGCKLIVIACNSASAHGLEAARRHYPNLPIVGLVPALKPAVIASSTGHVAVLATKATLDGTLLNQVITNVATPKGTQVTKYFDPQLVPWVESGMPETSEVAQRLRQQVQCFAHAGVDYLVLGCTHYPFFKAFLINEIKTQRLAIQVVDSGQAIAVRVQSLLAEKNLLAQAKVPVTTYNDERPPLIFYATKHDARLDKLITRLLGVQTQIEYMP